MKEKKQEIINLYNKYGLKILEEVKNMDLKLTCIDSFGYKYCLTPYNLSKRKSFNMATGAFNNKNPFKEYNINLYVKKEGKGCRILDVAKKIDTENCLFKCRICGRKFSQIFKIFKQSNNKCCSYCLKKVKKKKNKDILYITDIFSKAGYKLLDTEYNGTHYAYYIKDNFGYKGRMLPYTAKKKKSKIEKFNSKNIYSIENINLYLKENNINLKCIETRPYNTYLPLKFQCHCGEIFFCLWDNVKKGKWKCNKCSHSTSNNEYKARIYLDYLNVSYITQYNIGKYCDAKALYLDFYVPDLKLAIEINGEQHYMPVRFGGVDESVAIENYQKQIQRDNLKCKYCSDNNIELLEISYIDINNEKYKTILSTKINELRK